MADIRINALATTAASTASDDFVAVDGSANGTRKLNAFSPTFGGNLTVSGTGTSSFAGVVTATGNGTFGGNSLAGNRILTVSNTATAHGAWASMAVDTSVSGLKLAHLSSGWSGTFLTGGPTATQAAIYTTSSAPIVFGVNSTYVGKAESTGWTLAGNLTVSGTQITNTGAAESTGNIRLSHASGGKVIRWASSNYNVDLYQSGDNDILRARVANFAISSDPTFATNYTTIAAGNIATTGNLTVSGTGNSGVAGGFYIAGSTVSPNNTACVDITWQSTYGKISAINRGVGNYPLALQPEGGNLLIGTTTDGGQKLQVNGAGYFAGQLTALGISHTFGSGGTSTNNALITLNGSSASNYGAYLLLQRNSVNKWSIGTYSGIQGGASDDYLIYNQTASNEALRIAAATSNATFAGTVSVAKGAPQVKVSLDRNSSTDSSYVRYTTNGTQNWVVGTGVTGSDTNYAIYSYGGGGTALSLSYTDGNATFAGTVTATVNKSAANYTTVTTYSSAGSSTTTVHTFANANVNRSWIVSTRQQGSAANTVVGFATTYGGTLVVYRIAQSNTTGGALDMNYSASGLALQLTIGSGYGTTTWDTTITPIQG